MVISRIVVESVLAENVTPPVPREVPIEILDTGFRIGGIAWVTTRYG